MFFSSFLRQPLRHVPEGNLVYIYLKMEAAKYSV